MPVDVCTGPLFHSKVLFGKSVRVELGLLFSKQRGKLKSVFNASRSLFPPRTEGLWLKQAIFNVTFQLL